jgi:hypothetical protein
VSKAGKNISRRKKGESFKFFGLVLPKALTNGHHFRKAEKALVANTNPTAPSRRLAIKKFSSLKTNSAHRCGYETK